ncbi:hypothetical protein [Actinoplanes sp. L3-i22]|uniref:hypothetical protein n=1 Tax=Actinoplanes sp. L3-i22 TaxID=2836373 RepID=UPI001C8420C2|nr:hypothetical protein [Actinoplanes sp. L3-i22]
MRRLVFSIVVGFGLVAIGGTGASAADPTPTATVSAKATAGKKICQIKDPLLDEISGLVATKTGFIAINDSTDDKRRKIFTLDTKCAIKSKIELGGSRDTEDMILSPDGKTLWIADTGDNEVLKGGETRTNVGLWTVPMTGKRTPVLHRLSYPDGDKHDAEALLLDGDGLPIIVTKELGTALIYKPAAALKNNNEVGVPMKKVGELSLPATETASNAFAKIFNRVITGGSVNAGGTKVVLRTYTDASEWDVSNGDVLAALKTKPRTTGLPDETFGEAISYSADGKTFYTVSDMNGDHDTENWIRQYVPATEVAAISKTQAGGAADKSWYSDLKLGDITKMVGAVGVLGFLLVAIGVIGIVRFRKAHPAGVNVDDGPSGGIGKVDPSSELIGVGSGGAPRNAAYNGGAGGGNGPVYGKQPPAGPQQRPGVYGGQGGGGAQYGRPAGPGGAGGGQQPRGPQQRPQGQQPPGPQGQPPRAPQQPPQRAPQPPRNPQQPQRGPGPQQQQPPRGGGGGGVYGGQQPPRPPQGGGQQPRPGNYGGGRPPQGRDQNGFDRR